METSSVFVITPARGLVDARRRIQIDDLLEFAQVDIEEGDPRYRKPLERMPAGWRKSYRWPAMLFCSAASLAASTSIFSSKISGTSSVSQPISLGAATFRRCESWRRLQNRRAAGPLSTGDERSWNWSRNSIHDDLALAACALQFGDINEAEKILAVVDDSGRKKAAFYAMAARLAKARQHLAEAKTEWGEALQLAPTTNHTKRSLLFLV
ncbi:MAG TPA: hypothetical protein VEU75_05725 [Candidatus Acidoferrum sp.]|nr:hypothetical protein [Candidatus Acidoferrum sp.]